MLVESGLGGSQQHEAPGLVEEVHHVGPAGSREGGVRTGVRKHNFVPDASVAPALQGAPEAGLVGQELEEQSSVREEALSDGPDG